MTDPTEMWHAAMDLSTSARLRETQAALAASQQDLTRVEERYVEALDACRELTVALAGQNLKLIRAQKLLEYALHLRQHGERAPGGGETWARFDRDCEAFLRGES